MLVLRLVSDIGLVVVVLLFDELIDDRGEPLQLDGGFFGWLLSLDDGSSWIPVDGGRVDGRRRDDDLLWLLLWTDGFGLGSRKSERRKCRLMQDKEDQKGGWGLMSFDFREGG